MQSHTKGKSIPRNFFTTTFCYIYFFVRRILQCYYSTPKKHPKVNHPKPFPQQRKTQTPNNHQKTPNTKSTLKFTYKPTTSRPYTPKDNIFIDLNNPLLLLLLPDCSKMLSLGNTTATNKTVLDRYMKLPIPDNKCQVMYVWVDGSGENLRSKTRTVDFIPKSPSGKREGEGESE